MEIRQLKYFVRIVELGSLTRAAEALFIAQPALSQQMAGLERDLGVKLLIRSVRGVHTTNAGYAFYKQANAVLKQIEECRHVVRSASEQPSGAVSVGLSTSISLVLAVPLISKVRLQFPNVQIEFHESSSSYLEDLVINGRIDIGVLFRPNISKGLKFRNLLNENLFLVIPPGVESKSTTVTLDEVSKCPLFLASRPNSVRVGVDGAFANAGMEYELCAEINSTTVIKGLVQAGLGFAVLPWSAINTEIMDGRLQARQIVGPEILRTVSLCVSGTAVLSLTAERVYELMITTVSELISEGNWRHVRLCDAA